MVGLWFCLVSAGIVALRQRAAAQYAHTCVSHLESRFQAKKQVPLAPTELKVDGVEIPETGSMSFEL